MRTFLPPQPTPISQLATEIRGMDTPGFFIIPGFPYPDASVPHETREREHVVVVPTVDPVVGPVGKIYVCTRTPALDLVIFNSGSAGLLSWIRTNHASAPAVWRDPDVGDFLALLSRTR